LSYDLSKSISIVSLLVKLVLVHGIIDKVDLFITQVNNEEGSSLVELEMEVVFPISQSVNTQ